MAQSHVWVYDLTLSRTLYWSLLPIVTRGHERADPEGLETWDMILPLQATAMGELSLTLVWREWSQWSFRITQLPPSSTSKALSCPTPTSITCLCVRRHWSCRTITAGSLLLRRIAGYLREVSVTVQHWCCSRSQMPWTWPTIHCNERLQLELLGKGLNCMAHGNSQGHYNHKWMCDGEARKMKECFLFVCLFYILLLYMGATGVESRHGRTGKWVGFGVYDAKFPIKQLKTMERKNVFRNH